MARDEAAGTLHPDDLPPEPDTEFRRRILRAHHETANALTDTINDAHGPALDLLARRFGLERKDRKNG